METTPTTTNGVVVSTPTLVSSSSISVISGISAVSVVLSSLNSQQRRLVRRRALRAAPNNDNDGIGVVPLSPRLPQLRPPPDAPLSTTPLHHIGNGAIFTASNGTCIIGARGIKRVADATCSGINGINNDVDATELTTTRKKSTRKRKRHKRSAATSNVSTDTEMVMGKLIATPSFDIRSSNTTGDYKHEFSDGAINVNITTPTISATDMDHNTSIRSAAETKDARGRDAFVTVNVNDDMKRNELCALLQHCSADERMRLATHSTTTNTDIMHAALDPQSSLPLPTFDEKSARNVADIGIRRQAKKDRRMEKRKAKAELRAAQGLPPLRPLSSMTPSSDGKTESRSVAAEDDIDTEPPVDLSHVQWPVVTCRTITFTHKYIVAPMVDASELAFRMLCRAYGADCAYSPMYHADKFVNDETYRSAFTTCPQDRPLVVQFAACDASSLLAASLLVQDQCDAVDLNLGCPLREAKSAGWGSWLLDERHHPKVCDMVASCARALRIPITVKIRLLPTLEATLAFARRLEASGAALLCVHGRHRTTPREKRVGPAKLDWISEVKKALRIPVITNGNTRSWRDVKRNLWSTRCDGLMAGEGLLSNPALFSNSKPDPLDISEEYLQYAIRYTAPLGIAFRHIRKICKHVFAELSIDNDLSRLLESCRTADDARGVLGRCRTRREAYAQLAEAGVDRSLLSRQRRQPNSTRKSNRFSVAAAADDDNESAQWQG